MYIFLPPTTPRHCLTQSASSLVGAAALSAGLSDRVRRQLMWWMGGTAAWVYSMVVLGGTTRLTRSGLSMTDWKFTGETCGGRVACCAE